MNRRSSLAFALCLVGLVLAIINATTTDPNLLLLVAALSFTTTGSVLAGRTPKALKKPETDDKGYVINPAMETEIDLLEAACQIGEYAPGKPKYKCQHEWINGTCFWCDAHEQPHRPRKFARNATPTDPIDTLEAILNSPEPEPSTKQAAIRVATQFVANGQAHIVKRALDDIGARRVMDLREDQIEPFIRGLANQPWKKRY